MSILFYNTTFDKLELWKKLIRKTFNTEKIISINDTTKFDEVEYAIIWKLPKGILSKLINLKIIFSMGAGVDHIINLPDFNKNIPIIRIKDPTMGERITNYCLAQILNYQLNLKFFQKYQLKKIWSGERTPIDNQNITIGILGLGYLGKRVAKTLLKLNYNVIGFKNIPSANSMFQVYTKSRKKNFIKKSDIIISLLPLTSKTKYFINKNFLKSMKSKSCLISIGRGEVINEKDLINHLKKNKNFFAYLDVFTNEPLNQSSKFWSMDNVTITPHIAGVTEIESAIKHMYMKYQKFKSGKKIKSDIKYINGY